MKKSARNNLGVFPDVAHALFCFNQTQVEGHPP
jgi:hypothetical protein